VGTTQSRSRRGRIIRLATGWVLTIAGLVLGPFPILPGGFLIIPGIAILCAESRWVRALIRRYREKRLMKRALREAEKVGLKINLEHDPEVDGEETLPRDRGTGSTR
jgi:uncharacterized protein (DUF58 family)